MKKVEVYLVSKRAGDVFLIRGEGELVPLEYTDTDIVRKSQTAIFHAKQYSPYSRQNWYTVNLWTGLFVTGGTTKKKCLEEFEKVKTRYLQQCCDVGKVEFFETKHKELERLKQA